MRLPEFLQNREQKLFAKFCLCHNFFFLSDTFKNGRNCIDIGSYICKTTLVVVINAVEGASGLGHRAHVLVDTWGKIKSWARLYIWFHKNITFKSYFLVDQSHWIYSFIFGYK